MIRLKLRLIAFLQREGALETWRYERRVILLVEAFCLLASVVTAPTQRFAALQLVTAPLALWAAELARADRSAAARKAERAMLLRLPAITLACEKDLEQVAKNKQLVTFAWPVVILAGSLASAGPHISWAIVVGFVTSCIRLAMVELYGPWRRWYRRWKYIYSCRNPEGVARMIEWIEADGGMRDWRRS